MNEKQLLQIDSWLQGQHRYKLLDCEQTYILKLKGALLQVWLASYMYENDDQQSWLSNAAMMRATGIASEHTVIDAKRWLTENGWLRNTGHVAAMKYENPSQGAYTVPIVTTDNPCKNRTPAIIAPRYPKRAAKNALQNSQPPPAKIADKVSDSGSALGSVSASEDSTYESACTSKDSNYNGSDSRTYDVTTPVASLLPPSGRDENQKPQPKTKTRASASRWAQRYKAPKPEGFDTWSVSARAIWIEANRLRPGEVPVHQAEDAPAPLVQGEPVRLGKSALPTPPPGSAPPPAHAARYQCPVCEFSNTSASQIAAHIQDKHPELGQQSFKISCTEEGCPWRTWWNKIGNNKAKADADLLDHLEIEHNSASPRYNPWVECPDCGVEHQMKDNHQTRCRKKKE